jgi:hypothetical protein
MLEVRNILYFDPFYFKNGNKAKAKYFLVLKIIENKAVITSLPSSKDFIPAFQEKEDGCIEIPTSNFNCFAIPTTTCVTECDKHFERKTFLYGANIDEYEIKMLKDVYPLENVDYIVWGKMKQCLFDDLLCCFRNSTSVKRKYKRLL